MTKPAVLRQLSFWSRLFLWPSTVRGEIYSFAAILVEAIAQLLVVIRNNYTPICARLYAENRNEELLQMIQTGMRRVYLAAIPIGVLALVIYQYLGSALEIYPVLGESTSVFAVLMIGLMASAGYMLFSNILLASDRPGLHTWLMIGVVLFNVIANCILILLFGMIGAAIATALSFIALVIGLKVMGRKYLRLAF